VISQFLKINLKKQNLNLDTMSGVDTPMKLLSLELDSMTESTSEELDNKMAVDENVDDENSAPEKPSSDVISDLPLSSVAKRNLTAGKSDPVLLFSNYIF
jgi:hypothetical protein